jgi:hypothetical protein
VLSYFWGFLNLEDEGIMILCNTENLAYEGTIILCNTVNHSPNNRESCPRRPESSAVILREPQITHSTESIHCI